MCFKDWWLLWKTRKKLAIAVGGFALGQLYFTIKGIESFPWLHYGMFSEPYHNPPEFIRLEQGLNDLLKPLPSKKREFVSQVAMFYINRKQFGTDNSPVAAAIEARFPPTNFSKLNPWLHDKLNQSADPLPFAAQWFYRLPLVDSSKTGVLLTHHLLINGKWHIEFHPLPLPGQP